MPDPTGLDERRSQIAARLAAVHDRIAAARVAAGRDDDVELVVVTKFHPVSDAATLLDLGVHHLGENRDQEAGPKITALPGRARATVHFIGQLQSNKARSVTAYADVVQSVDRARVVTALDRACAERGRRLDVLVQIALGRDGELGRGGVVPAEADALADLVAGSAQLDLRGVMAVAPLGADPRAAFAALRSVADGIRDRHPGAGWISAGMSGDLEDAVAEGATHLRVGTAILGSRQSHG